MLDLAELVAAPGASEAARSMGPGHRLGLVVGGGPGVTIRTTEAGIAVDPGTDEARVVAALGDDAFAALRSEELSVFGLLYSGLLTVERGEFGQFAAWEPALQALLYDRPVYDPGTALPFAGEDLARSFGFDDDPVAMAAFLERHGFLHVRSVFGHDELSLLSGEVERLRAMATTDDRRSWWATGADGSEVCCRLTFMGERSTAIAALADDRRLQRLADLSGLGLLPAPTRNDGISVVIKNPGVTDGLSDLPWHRDCGLGGHPLLCPGINLGIQLDRADAANGQLWFLPGSHRHGGPLGDPWAEGYPTVAIEADPGDVTLHYGHVLHAAPAPTGRGIGRRALYATATRQETIEFVGAGRGYNDVLFALDGQVRNVDEFVTTD